MATVLILYYSRNGHTAALANEVRHGVALVGDCEAQLRTVPPLDGDDRGAPASGPPYASKDDLRNCDALALGSPTRFGAMATPLKAFFDTTSDLWLSGAMIDKPAIVFTSSNSLHGGQESTLLSMMVPLLHHGMLVLGVPYSEAALMNTASGGSPYGASHVAKAGDSIVSLTSHEQEIARAVGRRLAKTASRLCLG